MNLKIFIKDIANNLVHEARKIIWSENEISIWSDTWYGRHILDHRCCIERIEIGTDINVLTKKEVKDINVLNIHKNPENERQINEIINLLYQNDACLNICSPVSYCGVYTSEDDCKNCIGANLFRLFNNA